MLERKIPRCYDEYDGLDDDEESDDADPAATCDDISDYLKPDLDLSQGISADLHLTNGVNGVSAGADQDDASQRLSQTPTDDNTRLVQIERHLRTLSSDPREFVSWFNSTRGVKWRVPFDKLSRYLIQQEIDDTVTARFGCQAARIVRILHDKGKLDEKQISQFAMVKNKEIRSTLTAMQEAGFVETQEVPKDSTRQPSRTIYLWFFDQDRVRRLLLNDTYKCMARLLQRVLVEKNKIKPVIEKAERTDVVGNEDRYLTVGERHTLRKWKETEEKLLVQLGRQDDLVATLRDFLPEVAPS